MSVWFVVLILCWLCVVSWESCGLDGVRFRKDFLYWFVWMFYIFLLWVKCILKFKVNYCVSFGLCLNFVFVICICVVGKKNDWNIFIYIFFFKCIKKKKIISIIKNRILLVL